MALVKNVMIVMLFGILLVCMIFFGVTMIEAKGKKMTQAEMGTNIVLIQPLNIEKADT
ncbi:hypothetical protein [Litchfieldia salsa]|uniref:Uncharacterized protein n=1 Tax=Litchfieldia salsa TaxID=930152 RepID=A0A1H0RWU7_9BACI|nr:hypothetical protein [Litchfieldia salsa]SDP33900.1 hypothetical protein SAMN05216565_102420 [Litchfieldia salsa]